jgi:hypothetical protein
MLSCPLPAQQQAPCTAAVQSSTVMQAAAGPQVAECMLFGMRSCSALAQDRSRTRSQLEQLGMLPQALPCALQCWC